MLKDWVVGLTSAGCPAETFRRKDSESQLGLPGQGVVMLNPCWCGFSCCWVVSVMMGQIFPLRLFLELFIHLLALGQGGEDGHRGYVCQDV